MIGSNQQDCAATREFAPLKEPRERAAKAQQMLKAQDVFWGALREIRGWRVLPKNIHMPASTAHTFRAQCPRVVTCVYVAIGCLAA